MPRLLVLLALTARFVFADSEVQLEFRFDRAKRSRAYACTVRTNVHKRGTQFAGAIRSSARLKGKARATINAGTYTIFLGVHQRSKAPERKSLAGKTFEAAQSSKVMGKNTKAALKRAYARQADGRYRLVLTDQRDKVYWIVRFALALWEEDNDRIRVVAEPGKFRLALVLEADGPVPVTYPSKDGRERREANLVHIHSGPDASRGARGCLTIPQSSWQAFVAPLLMRYPTLDDWLVTGPVGKKVGTVSVK